MALTTLVRQVRQVRRRLLLGSLLTLLAWSWVVALAIAAGYFFVQPMVLSGAPEWLRWTVLGSLGAVATVFAITLCCLRAPNQVNAAMSLDERFGLRERVTTGLTLDPETAATPAGKALLADVEARLGKVRVSDRFPVALPWKPAAMLPAFAAAVALLALFWNPQFDTGRADAADNAPPPEAKATMEEQMKKLAASKPIAKKNKEPIKSEDLKKIEAEIEKFLQKPRNTRDDIRERVKDGTTIEGELERQQKQAAQRADAMREAMKQAERLARKKRPQQPQGPGKNAADALARGDMDRTRDELERLSRKQKEKEEKQERLKRKLRDKDLPKEEKEKLERELNELNKEMKKENEKLKEQLKEMQEMAERLSRKKEEQEKELKEMADNGELTKEELERELDEMKKNQLTDEEKKELEELARELAECEKCMNEGKKGEKASAKLAKAAKKCEGMCKNGENAQRAKMLAQMRVVRKAMNRAMARNNGGVGAGRRPEAKSETGHEDKFVPGEWDKGKVQVIGEGPKGGRKFDGPRRPEELQEEIKQAGQEAAAAIDRQRLPPSARKMARDYFEKVRGQDRNAKKK